MAKSRSFFGLRRGSTKSHTYQVLNGAQITKDRVVSVRNPQTEKQIYQRLVFLTVAGATKLLKPIINHSFENKAYGEESVRHFRSINLNKMRSLAAIWAGAMDAGGEVQNNIWLGKRGVTQLIPNSYIIADGSLATPKLFTDVAPSGGQIRINVPTLTMQIAGTEESGEKYVTLGQLMASFLGLRDSNEQLSMVCILRANPTGSDPSLYAYTFEDNTIGESIAYTTFTAVRVYLDTSIDLNTHILLTDTEGGLLSNASEVVADAITAALGQSSESDQMFVNMLNDVIASGNLNLDGSEVSYENENTVIDSYFEDSEGAGHVYAAGVVRSRLNGTKWLRSKTELTLATPTLTNNFGLYPGIAAAAWQEEVSLGNDGRFLNGGGVADQIGESFR